jgi:hypothetical protein
MVTVLFSSCAAFTVSFAGGVWGSTPLSPLIDKINLRYGRGAIGFGKPSEEISRFTGHAAFQRVPEEFEF